MKRPSKELINEFGRALGYAVAPAKVCDFTDTGECAAKTGEACICADPAYQKAKRELQDAIREVPNVR